MRGTLPWAAALLLAALPAAALGASATVSSAVELARQADALQPGEWVWAPSLAPAGPILVYANLSTQRATVYRNGVRIGVTTISSGKPGHTTPTGVFTILQKDAKHRSSTYNNAPMPNMQRLTWDGVALHAGNLPGYPASHGCVRMPMEFSRLLFGTTEMGGTVVIAGNAAEPEAVPLAGVLAPALEGGLAADHAPLAPDEQFRWRPELSPTGPVSIILSRTDQRAIVLRNGVEIGRSRISIPSDRDTTEALVLGPDAAGRPQWLRSSLPGHAGTAEPLGPGSLLDQLHAPSAFVAAVRPLMQPGTTVVVTNARVRSGSSERRLVVLASGK
jgi:hypothetical protein